VLALVLAAAVVVVTVDRTRGADERSEATSGASDDRGEALPDPDEAGGVGGTFNPDGEPIDEPEAAADDAVDAGAEDAPVDAPAADDGLLDDDGDDATEEPLPVNIMPRSVVIRTSGVTGTILVPATQRDLAARSLVLRRVPGGAPVVARMQPVRPGPAKPGGLAFARTFLVSPKLTGTWMVTVTAVNGELTQAQVGLPCRATTGCKLVLVSPAVKP